MSGLNMCHVARRRVFRVSDQTLLKSACSLTEAIKKLEALNVPSLAYHIYFPGSK